ncbi:hypothetical protein BUALT_Bualt04G0124700 [Buddleja alternifolia]|uniref:SANTA domain-containing protein n=1 Tax=Buddleja alternifolia TaxID=168488 RepID=A0AAV6XZ78_9LAMI|nr:hypothetical protein BUALT_Bualt04G0124700 [Buddleja alternifolia]
MATPAQPLLRRNSRRKIQSAPSSTTTAAICSSFLKQVFLHDWWLIRADSDDSDGGRLGIGGFTSKENQGIRSFLSAPIVKRHDAVTLKTFDGITIMVHGHLNRSRTLENGFSHEVCDDFVIGFPYYWEEFAVLSVEEELAHFSVLREISGSDAYKTPTPGDHGSSMLSRNIFDEILQQNLGDAFHCSGASKAKKESSQLKTMVSATNGTPLNHKKINSEKRSRDVSNVEYVQHSGPLTRSRTRVQKN